MKLVRPGDRIEEILYGERGRDALAAMDVAMRNGKSVERDYMVALGNEGESAVNMSFVPPSNDDAPFTIGVRLSMWKTTWFSFRSGVHQNGECDFKTNSMGWRDNEVALPKPAGVVRIVCTGGANTVGGPINELTYPALLEKILRTRFRTDLIEVVNCGIYGLSSAGEMLHYNEYLKLEPDIIVQSNVASDLPVLFAQLIYSPAQRVRDPYIRQIPKHVHRAGAILPLQSEERWCDLRRMLHKSEFLHLYANGLMLPGDATLRRGFDDYTIRNMLKWLCPASNRGIKVALCSYDCPERAALSSRASDYMNSCIMQTRMWEAANYNTYCHTIDLYNDLVKETCSENNFTYVPVAENIIGGLDIYKDMCNMYVAGRLQKATIVADTIGPLVESTIEEMYK